MSLSDIMTKFAFLKNYITIDIIIVSIIVLGVLFYVVW